MRKKARSKKEERRGKESKELLSALPKAMETMRPGRAAPIIALHSQLLGSVLSASSIIFLARSIHPPSPPKHSKTLLIWATRANASGGRAAWRPICHRASVPAADLLRNVTCLAARCLEPQLNSLAKRMLLEILHFNVAVRHPCQKQVFRLQA